MKRYKIEFSQYSATIKIDSNCNSISFVNAGTIDCTINQFILPAGASLSIDGNENEIDTTVYNINFASVGLIQVIKKMYL
jgi:hypothetical protein